MTKPAHTASAVTRQFFSLLNQNRIPTTVVSKGSGISTNSLGNWKAGRNSPSVTDMEAALACVGLELVIRPSRSVLTQQARDALNKIAEKQSRS